MLVIAQGPGADPAAVAHDAYAAAKARAATCCWWTPPADCTPRRDSWKNSRKCRVLGKFGPGIPQERLLVLDAGLGQNALRQIEEFHAAVGVTGLVITKLDGTAKGGIVLAGAPASHPYPFHRHRRIRGGLGAFDARGLRRSAGRIGT